MQCNLCYAVKKIFRMKNGIDIAKCYDKANLRHICLLLPATTLDAGECPVGEQCRQNHRSLLCFLYSSISLKSNTCISAYVLLECKVSERVSSEIY